MLDVATGTLRPVDVGTRPRWSPTGRYLAYWGPFADELRVVRDGRVVARLEPRIPEYGWQGDTLLFIQGVHLMAWTEGAGTHQVAAFSAEQAPVYPQDDVYFSGDGRRILMTRYFPDGTLRRYVAPTDSGRFELVPGGEPFAEWAPAGSILLLRDGDRFTVRDLDAGTTTDVSASRDAVHVWGADGRMLLIGSVSPTVPGGDAFDVFTPRWPSAGAPIGLPNVLGARSFSPDGSRFVGTLRTSLEGVRLAVYACGAASSSAAGDAPTRLARIDAAKTRWVRPASGDISQFFQGAHTGIDIAAPFGSLIVAADDGVVTEAGWVRNGGDRVCLAHAGGLETCYFHDSALLVSTGERLARGQPIALIGITGLTDGPHVHWEAHPVGSPETFLDPLQR